MPHPTYTTELRAGKFTAGIAERVEAARRTPRLGCPDCQPCEACSQHLAEFLVTAVATEDLVLMTLHDADEVIYLSVERLVAERIEQLSEVVNSLCDAVAFSSQDWSVAGDFAWLYGILVGWKTDEDDPDSVDQLPAFAKRFRWPADKVERLRRFRATVATITD